MIEVHDLTFSYHGADAPAISGLDFSVARGEVFGFLGPSGAGKSTTQKVLIRLVRGYRGRASVMGRELRGWGHDYYERIGVAFEAPNHFLRLTARENLAFFGRLYRRGAGDPLAALDAVGLAGDADTPVGAFSKGMKNRLTLARALQHGPELLFLDEPTAGLDPVNRRRVQALVREQQRAGRTVFLTTHDMAVADDLCDRVAFIVGGRIAAVGAPRALRLRYGSPTVRVEHRDEAGAAVVDEWPLEGIGENEAFLRVLRSGRAQTIHSREATLEDVFVRVTGRTLE
jgi:fluoroquinolone transport system ATP-binding protein